MAVTFQWSWNEWERVTSVSMGTFLYSFAPDFLPQPWQFLEQYL